MIKRICILGVLAGVFTGCGQPTSTLLSPHESLLSITNEYHLFRSADLYRQRFPKDLSQQNVARATLVRLANYEALYPGKFTPEIQLLSGEARADLGDYSAAGNHFLRCAEFDTPLRPKARESAEIASLFEEVVSRPLDNSGLEAHLRDRDRQIADLRTLENQFRATRWETLAKIEREASEIARAELLANNQFAIPDGPDRARTAFEKLVEDHSESRLALSHALRLANFHLDQARLMERLQDPERGSFDFTRFASHLEIALDILHRVSQADGYPEKTLARHQLDEALAYYDLIRDLAF